MSATRLASSPVLLVSLLCGGLHLPRAARARCAKAPCWHERLLQHDLPASEMIFTDTALWSAGGRRGVAARAGGVRAGAGRRDGRGDGAGGGHVQPLHQRRSVPLNPLLRDVAQLCSDWHVIRCGGWLHE